MTGPFEHAEEYSPNLIGLFAAGPFALGAFVVSFILGLATFDSLGWNTETIRILAWSVVVAPGAYAYGVRHRLGRQHGRSMFAAVANMIALVLGAAMLAVVIVPVLAQAFAGYVFTPFWGSIFLAAYSFMLAYAMAAWGARMWVGDTLLFAVIVVGLSIISAAINTGDANWWEGAISTLGTSASLTARLFSVACMVAGIMIVLCVPSLREPLRRASDLDIATEAAARWFPRVMGLLGVLLFLVGAFPMDGGDVQFFIHNTSGVAFGVILVIAMVLAFRAFPGMPNRFFWYSWAFALLGAIAVPLYIPLGQFSLAEVEVVAFSLSALWAVLLFAILKDGGADTPAEG